MRSRMLQVIHGFIVDLPGFDFLHVCAGDPFDAALDSAEVLRHW